LKNKQKCLYLEWRVIYYFLIHRAKYETQDFLKPSLRITSKGSFDATNAVKSVTSSISSASGKHVADDTREFVGELNITVVRGIQLAVRDMLTSDPYVVLTLGEQVCFFF
jgi:stromal membrane-associated protein